MQRFERYSGYKDSGVDWLGAIPKKWGAERLKFVVNINTNSLPENTNGNFEFDYVDISSISYENGIENTEHFTFANAPSRARRLAKNGDTVISTVRTYLKAIDLITSDKSKFVFSTGFAVLTPRKNVIPSFLLHFVRSKSFTKQVELASKGMSYPAINSTDLSCLSIFLPPLPEQTAIANFLDEKTTKIDTAIAQKEEMISLLKERKKILIQHAITKGLDPDAKMKNSGVDWIGEIPKHWQVKSLKYCTKIFRGKFTHRPRNDSRLYDGKYPFFQTGDVARAGKFLSEYRQTLNDSGLRVSTLIPKGTIVITIAANIGDVAILDIDACFPDSIVGFAPMDILERDFFYNSLVVMKKQFMNSTIKNTQMNLNVDRIGVNSIAIPPLAEQSTIVDFIETKSTKIETSITLQQQQITKLKEYKSILIDNAVTGKIKVC